MQINWNHFKRRRSILSVFTLSRSVVVCQKHLLMISFGERPICFFALLNVQWLESVKEMQYSVKALWRRSNFSWKLFSSTSKLNPFKKSIVWNWFISGEEGDKNIFYEVFLPNWRSILKGDFYAVELWIWTNETSFNYFTDNRNSTWQWNVDAVYEFIVLLTCLQQAFAYTPTQLLDIGKMLTRSSLTRRTLSSGDWIIQGHGGDGRVEYPCFENLSWSEKGVYVYYWHKFLTWRVSSNGIFILFLLEYS